MDFFEHQQAARRSTTWLVILFALAVIATIAGAYVLFAAIRGVVEEPRTGSLLENAWDGVRRFDLVTLELSAGGTAALVALAGLWKMFELRAGGVAVAESLGARPVAPDTRDPKEKRLWNVVEEMAIASGIPAPSVYLLEHEGQINAFAAGHSIDDAVVAVTRGALDRLDRDELQAVLAHELSHVLNGDMRLNLRLVAIVHGIVAIAIAGRILVRIGAETSSSRARRKGKGDARGFLVVGGLGLMALGYLGSLLGAAIRAAVSRQREFLADASAVQFTRNPRALHGALTKIGEDFQGSRIHAPRALEVSHLFFAQAVRSFFATHPPLAERIRRLGGVPVEAREAPETTPSGPALGFAARVGHPERTDLDTAAGAIAELPAALREALHDPYAVRAALAALLVARDGATIEHQLALVGRTLGRDTAELTERLLPNAAALTPGTRLAAIEVAAPAVRALSLGQLDALTAAITALAAFDRRIDVEEWVLERLVARQLDVARASQNLTASPRRGVVRVFDAVRDDAALVLSLLAHEGHAHESDARASFARAAARLERPSLALLPRASCTLSGAGAALARLDRLEPGLKRKLVLSLADAVEHDGRVSLREAALLRGVSFALGCPLPPTAARTG